MESTVGGGPASVEQRSSASPGDVEVTGTTGVSLHYSFLSARQHRFKVRRLFLSGDDVYLNFFETCFFQPMVQITFRKPEPAIAVKLVCPFEIVFEQIQNHHLPAWPQNFMHAGNGFRRLLRMVQRLAQNNQFHALGLNGRILQIAQAKFQSQANVLKARSRAPRRAPSTDARPWRWRHHARRAH